MGREQRWPRWIKRRCISVSSDCGKQWTMSSVQINAKQNNRNLAPKALVESHNYWVYINNQCIYRGQWPITTNNVITPGHIQHRALFRGTHHCLGAFPAATTGDTEVSSPRRQICRNLPMCRVNALWKWKRPNILRHVLSWACGLSQHTSNNQIWWSVHTQLILGLHRIATNLRPIYEMKNSGILVLVSSR